MYRLVLGLAATLALIPSMVVANCGNGGDCAVGGIGTGGTASGGNAQGFRFHGTEGGASVTNSGNADAGRLNITGADSGSLSGRSDQALFAAGPQGFSETAPGCVAICLTSRFCPEGPCRRAR